MTQRTIVAPWSEKASNDASIAWVKLSQLGSMLAALRQTSFPALPKRSLVPAFPLSVSLPPFPLIVSSPSLPLMMSLPSAADERVVVRTAADEVDAGAAVGDVVTRAAVDRVFAVIAVERVVAVVAVERVIACIAEETICASPTKEIVVLGATDELVVPSSPLRMSAHQLGPRGYRCPIPLERIVPVASGQGVDAVVSIEEIVVIATVDEVVPVPPRGCLTLPRRTGSRRHRRR